VTTDQEGVMAMLRVRDLMSAAPEVVPPDADLHEVLVKMNRHGYRHLPVVEDGQLVGIITDRDVRLAVNSPVLEEDAHLTRQEALEGVRAFDCMTPDPQCVTSDMPLYEAADLLSLNKFGAMPVVDEGKLIGLISTIDFLKHYAAQR
jgi:acetoin utilization protein AcuB